MMCLHKRLIPFFALLCVLLFAKESEAGKVIKYDLKEECGAYFETEVSFSPYSTDWLPCIYAGYAQSWASYVNISGRIADENVFMGWYLAPYREQLVYPIGGELVGGNNKILKRERVDSLKKTKNDKVVVTLIKDGGMFIKNWARFYEKPRETLSKSFVLQ